MIEVILGGLIFGALFLLEDVARRSILFPLFFFLPTLFHELCHFLVALFLGGRPSLPNLIPRKSGEVWVLGEVRFYATPFNAFPSAMAPLLLLPLSVLAYSYLPLGLREVTAWVFLKGALPSSQDVKVAFSYFTSAFLWIAGIGGALNLLSEKLPAVINLYAEQLASLLNL